EESTLFPHRAQELAASVKPPQNLGSRRGSRCVHEKAVVRCAQVRAPQPGVVLDVFAESSGFANQLCARGIKGLRYQRVIALIQKLPGNINHARQSVEQKAVLLAIERT